MKEVKKTEDIVVVISIPNGPVRHSTVFSSWMNVGGIVEWVHLCDPEGAHIIQILPLSEVSEVKETPDE